MRHLSLSILLVFGVLSSQAQDPLFTQKVANINHYNPALLGSQSDFAVNLNYRADQVSLPLYPMIGSLGSNYNLENGLGFGLTMTHNILSVLKRSSVKANANYAFELNDFEFKLGSNIGVVRSIAYYSGLRVNQPIKNDPIYSPTLDIGLSAYYKGFMLGASGLGVVGPRYISIAPNEEVKPNSRYVGMLGYHKTINDFKIGGLLTWQQQNYSSIADFQLNTQYKFIKLGIGTRRQYGTFGTNPWYMAGVGVQFDKFSIGYNYDHLVLGNYSFGSHEATAAWYIKGLKKDKGMSEFLNMML